MNQVQRFLLCACLLPAGVWGHLANLPNSKLSHVPLSLEKRVDTVQASTAAPELCTAAKCQTYAKHIKDSLAPNYTAINPCVDFDKYACDGWRASHNYRQEQASLSVSTVMSDTIRDLLHSLLEGEYAENTTLTGASKAFDQQNFKKMKTAYNTCMKEELIKSYGVTPVRKILDEFEAIYPVKGPATGAGNAVEELTQTISWLAKRGVSGLLSASASVSYGLSYVILCRAHLTVLRPMI
jgi:endothelin-converting enzyme